MEEHEQHISGSPMPEHEANYSRVVRNGLLGSIAINLTLASGNILPKDVDPNLFIYLAIGSGIGAVVAHWDYRQHERHINKELNRSNITEGSE